jgi:FkbM family methyltransferase
VPFVGDTRLAISKKMRGVAANYYFGLPELAEASLALHFLRPGELLGDIGANIGALSVAAAGVSKARVVAMEPVPETYIGLRDNIALNRLEDRVQTLNLGAGENAGTLNFSTDKGSADRIVTDGTGRLVEVRPLNDVFSETPDVLFLDVEGFEPAVVKGASRILSDPKLKISVIETLGLAADYGFDEEAMHDTMRDYGFSPVTYDPFRRQLDVVSGISSPNTIYARDLPYVQARVRDALPFRVEQDLI